MADNNDDFSAEEFLNEARGLDQDQPDFDILFQHGLLKLALEEDHFCSQLCRYLGNDKDLKEIQIFENKPTQEIFTLICQSIEKFGTRPTEGELRQLFTNFDEDDKEMMNITLDNIYKSDTHNDIFYRKYVGAFVKKCKFQKGMIRIREAWKTGSKKNKDASLPDDVMQEVLDSIRTVEFEKQNIVTLKDYDQLFLARANEKGTKIPTGVTDLDNDLLGGLPRQSLVVVLSGTNVGKSIFCTSLGAQALKAKDERGKYRGFKVLQINLEGRHDESLFRYMANLAQVPYKSIVTNTLTEAEKERIAQVKQDFSSRLLIRNMTNFGVTIEDLVAYTREVYKDFKFDMLIIDYGQLLETRVKTENHRLAQAKVFRGLSTMSNEFNCVVISPAQATRGAQENQNMNSFKNRNMPQDKLPVMRSNDISEAFEIARVSSVILSLNRTDDEVAQGKLRIFLEKQREGTKNKSYGVFTNYPMCDVITGSYYDPYATMVKENEQVKAEDTVRLDDQVDPEVTDADRIESKKDELDYLVVEYQELTDKENSRKFDSNQEKKKPSPNKDILLQLSNDLDKIKNQKLDISKKAQEAIKIIDPNANEILLKEMEKSLRDLQRSSDATEDQILAQERIVNRYKLALKGKL